MCNNNKNTIYYCDNYTIGESVRPLLTYFAVCVHLLGRHHFNSESPISMCSRTEDRDNFETQVITAFIEINSCVEFLLCGVSQVIKKQFSKCYQSRWTID